MVYKDKEKEKAAKRRHYYANKEAYIQRKEERKAATAAWLLELKSTLSCELCGEDHVACIQFHHTNPADKDFGIAEAPTSGYSRERILAEIAKCQVLCANCHCKIHFSRSLV